MFTGIVQHVGRVEALTLNDFGARLMIDPRGWDHRPAPGESIAVDGCCLTVASRDNRGRGGGAGLLEFDVIRQTLDLTILGQLNPDDQVNLEHAATPQTLLGGHIVQGHIDAVGRVAKVIRDRTEHRLRLELAQRRPLPPQIVAQGSIALNGVSLTIAAVGASWFEVALIPATLGRTNLSALIESSPVNIEFDYVAKIVVNALHQARVKKNGPKSFTRRRLPRAAKD